MAKIFVRERRDVGQGAGRPRFAVVGVQGSDLQFFKTNIRRNELEAIAQAVGAEVVILPRGSGEHNRQGGKRRRRQEQADSEE